MTIIKNFLSNEEGATAIEYGLIAALIAVAAIAGMRSIGGELSNTFSRIANDLRNANSAPSTTPTTR